MAQMTLIQPRVLGTRSDSPSPPPSRFFYSMICDHGGPFTPNIHQSILCVIQLIEKKVTMNVARRVMGRIRLFNRAHRVVQLPAQTIEERLPRISKMFVLVMVILVMVMVMIADLNDY
jgi:hypothetical protein